MYETSNLISTPLLLTCQSSSVSLSSLNNLINRLGNSQIEQLTQGTWSLGFPAAQLVHCRYSWHTGVIKSSLLQPQLLPCLLSHPALPITGQVVETGWRGVFCALWHCVNMYPPCPFPLLFSFVLFKIDPLWFFFPVSCFTCGNKSICRQPHLQHKSYN